MQTRTSVPSTSVPAPRAASMFWQTWTSNVDVRRQWDRLGVGTTIFQWVAVNGSSFIPIPGCRCTAASWTWRTSPPGPGRGA